MCQAITEMASIKNAKMTPSEFNILNGCLDIAIASAVSEYQFKNNEANENREILHLGFLAHELRNTISNVSIAYELIKSGTVGLNGSTASMLEANLIHMTNLIDRSLSEVRMRAEADLFIEKFRLSELFDQIGVTAHVVAEKKNQTFDIQIDWNLEIEADRQFISSAVANLIQNAMKYTKTNGKIWLRAREVGSRVQIEVEDTCGGIEESKVSAIFKPFIQVDHQGAGVGLGLSIVQKAIRLSQGTITVKNKGAGCIFTIDIPKVLKSPPSQKISVPGINSVQPKLKKN